MLLSLIGRHLNLVPKSLIVLDIGCGDAFILEMISKRLPDSKLIGLDIGFDEKIINRYSREYPNIKFYSSFEDMTFNLNKPVNIVLILDVLEHTLNDTDMLKNIVQSSVINRSALFLVTVPAFQFMFSSHDEWLGHYRRYDLKSLSYKVEQTNLKIIDKGYFFFSPLLIRIMTNFWEKLTKRPFSGKGVGSWKGPSFMMGLAKTILYLDYTVASFINKFGFKIPGLSCYVICQKQGL